MSPPPHFLLVTFPAQGHINPGLQFAKRLIQHGIHVTFATSVYANRRMSSKPSNHHEHLKFAAFSDGYDDGFNTKDLDVDHYMSEIRRHGTQTLGDLITSCADEGRPITCLVYTLLLPWAARVARNHRIPSAMLWIQPAAVLNIYYYYYNGYGDVIKEICNNHGHASSDLVIKFPGFSSVGFSSDDLPSFFLPTNPKEYSFILSNFKEQLDELEKEGNPRILMNTFDALEGEALKGIDKYKLIAVGPLVPSAFLDAKDPSDTSFGGDLFQGTKDYRKWLDSQREASVIYISFGSIAVISKKQAEEVGRGLLKTGKPFLWLIREGEGEGEESHSCGFINELEQLGMIVPWCSQVEVLSHPSLGCFMTHCGWNSSLESLVMGVPVVAFPQWTDQATNAKLIQDVWATGVRVRPSSDDGLVHADEVKRCLEKVLIGQDGEIMRRNALNWKHSARQAAKQGLKIGRLRSMGLVVLRMTYLLCPSSWNPWEVLVMQRTASSGFWLIGGLK